MNSDTEWSIDTFSIILSRIIRKWILLIEFLSLGTSRDYAQISKGKGGTYILRMFYGLCNLTIVMWYSTHVGDLSVCMNCRSFGIYKRKNSFKWIFRKV